MSGDVTTEFDFVFWFGDLNYRVDMDRQMANKCLLRSDIMVSTVKSSHKALEGGGVEKRNLSSTCIKNLLNVGS